MLFCFRANIEEVETEVVEIEAKLDKVRAPSALRDANAAASGETIPFRSLAGVAKVLTRRF